jgi:hypothetical protein
MDRGTSVGASVPAHTGTALPMNEKLGQRVKSKDREKGSKRGDEAQR